MLVTQAKGRELVLRGVALHQQDATDQEGSQKKNWRFVFDLSISGW